MNTQEEGEDADADEGEASQDSNNDFYKSYYEEQERLKEEEAKAAQQAERAAEQAALRAKEAAERRAKEAAEKAAKSIKKRRGKTAEEKMVQHGVAHWAKKCEAEGLLEKPGTSKQTDPPPKPDKTATKVDPNLPTKEQVLYILHKY